MGEPEKPIIILANDDVGAWHHWKETLETYLRSKGIEADIRDAASSGEVKEDLNAIFSEGKVPALIIADFELEGRWSGLDIAEVLHEGHYLDRQDEMFAGGRTLPVAVISGGGLVDSFWDEKTQVRNHTGQFSNSVIEHLNRDVGDSAIAPQINAFRKLLCDALHIPWGEQDKIKPTYPLPPQDTRPSWQRGRDGD